MRYLSLCLIPAALLAQSTTTTYQTGTNGQRVATSTVDQSASGEKTQRMQSINGRPIPMEQVTERVLRDDSGGKVIERTLLKFDANGRPAGTEKITIEETPLAAGGKIAKETRATSDLNGRLTPVERRTTETRVSGQTTTTNVTLDRPTPNNSFQTAEKRTTVTTGPEGKQQSVETVDRADVAGRFRTVARTESSTQAAGAKTTQNTAVYEMDAVGKMALAKQTVATTTKGPAGDVTETSVYAAATLGRTPTQADRLQLQQQQVTERKIASDGSVTEVLSIRLPNPSDPTKLSAAQKISETVCTGKCLPTPPAAPTAKPKP
jgi:hypothetical protein